MAVTAVVKTWIGSDRCVALLAATAMALTLTACAKENTTGQTPTSTTATSTTTTTSAKAATPSSSAIPKANYDQLAVGIIDAISRGDFDAATVDFDSALLKKEPASKLSADWATYQQQFGTYQSHGDPDSVQRRDLTVVNVPLQMQQTPGQLRVSFGDKYGKVVGLWFLKAGTPVP
jgi:hypothetical protein